MEIIRTRCCVAGGGPAGIMAGLLLARSGIDVLVLEKHADFLRDFRGDTIHPSTLELMHELGFLSEFLRLPHQEVRHLHAVIEETEVGIADFTHLPTQCQFIALMPQWDFLDFLADRAKDYPSFALRMEAEVFDLIERDGRVAGVRVRTPGGEMSVEADLVIGADGRHSTVRERAGLPIERLGSSIDVLWMRLSRRPSDGAEPVGRIRAGLFMVMLDRGDYWQCAFVVPKGGFDTIKQRGIQKLRAEIGKVAPHMEDRLHEVRDWDDVKLLTVTVDRLREWARPGLLCIGDSAHAMSPIGGVGINLAIQDAVAAANILVEPLRRGAPDVEILKAVQARRMFPTRLTQRVQIVIQNRIITRALADPDRVSVPWLFRILNWFPFLQRIPARIVGVGIRPEHVRTPLAPGSG